MGRPAGGGAMAGCRTDERSGGVASGGSGEWGKQRDCWCA
jgi:hypothetical protein